MLGDMTPFRIAGNLYFVGTYAASCHMIDTGDGLILIDVGYKETADVVMESLNTLGFDVKDVKYILLSHGHYDHTDDYRTFRGEKFSFQGRCKIPERFYSRCLFA